MKHVPILDLVAQYETIREDVEREVREVFETQRFVGGPKVDAIEERVAGLCGVRRAVGVASGSDAILLVLMALGVGPGDEVVTTPYTFFSTVSAITRLGARPVFADIDPATCNVDPAAVADRLGERTRAVLVVHLFGQPADMDPILEAAGARGIPVVEDACQAIGATLKGRPAGSMGVAGCFSFFPSKNLGGAGDGGMIATDDEQLAERLAALRNHGSRRRYYHDEVGVNSRLDALQAAVLLAKIDRLEGWNEARAANAARYTGAFAGVDGIEPLAVSPDVRHIFHQYVLRAGRRDELKAHLEDAGIGCEIYYPVPLHLQACFASLGGSPGDFPESERAAAETLALPVYPELPREAQERVIEAIAGFAGG